MKKIKVFFLVILISLSQQSCQKEEVGFVSVIAYYYENSMQAGKIGYNKYKGYDTLYASDSLAISIGRNRVIQSDKPYNRIIAYYPYVKDIKFFLVTDSANLNCQEIPNENVYFKQLFSYGFLGAEAYSKEKFFTEVLKETDKSFVVGINKEFFQSVPVPGKYKYMMIVKDSFSDQTVMVNTFFSRWFYLIN